MFEKETHSTFVTPADQALAEQYRSKPTVVDPYLTDDELSAAASDRSDTLQIANGATIRVSEGGQRHTLQMDAGIESVVNTDVAGIGRRAEFLAEQMNLMVDPATGSPRPHLVAEYNRNALMLRQLQASAEFQRTFGLANLQRTDARSAGLAELQQEAAYQDQRTQDAAARELEARFGRVRIV